MIEKNRGNLYFGHFNLVHLDNVYLSITSVYFIVETSYLIMGMNSATTLYTLNIKVISEIKCIKS